MLSGDINYSNPILTLNQVYEEAYNNAIANEYRVINSEEAAYAYIIAHLENVTRTESGKLALIIDDVDINRGEYNAIMKLITNLNNLIEVNAIVVDENLHIIFNENTESEMLRHPIADIMSEARSHAIQLRTVYDNAPFSSKNLTAGLYFAQRVKSGGAWDYKTYMGTHTLYYMEDLGVNMTGETIGNFHYGYVGSAVWSATTLKSAAGMYQIISGTSSLGYWDSFFDDPADQSDIQWGINVYNAEH